MAAPPDVPPPDPISSPAALLTEHYRSLADQLAASSSCGAAAQTLRLWSESDATTVWMLSLTVGVLEPADALERDKLSTAIDGAMWQIADAVIRCQDEPTLLAVVGEMMVSGSERTESVPESSKAGGDE